MFLSIDCIRANRPLSDGAAWHIRLQQGWYVARHIGTGSQVRLKLREAYPRTYCHQAQDGRISMGYGPLGPRSEDEFLQIQLERDGSVSIKRDMYCILPIFYSSTNGSLIASDDYQKVCTQTRGLHLDQQNLLKTFTGIFPDTPGLLWRELHILGERETLRYRNGKLSLQEPPPRPWTFAGDLEPTDARTFPRILAQSFDDFIQTRLEGSAYAFELSGGLDSAFLPLFMSAQGNPLNAPAGTLVQPGSATQHQLFKLGELESYTSLQSQRVYLDASKHMPLLPMISSGQYSPFPIYHATYYPAMAELLDYFVSSGAEVVVTGWGGDQLLEHRPRPSSAAVSGKRLPSFMSEAALHKIEESGTSEVHTLLSHIAIHENIALAGMYIDRGLWPVSPYHNLGLYNFSQALPVQYRANKNIFRAYFEAKGWPRSLYMGINEDFCDFFNTCILSATYAKLIEYFIQDSEMEKLGYVSTHRIREMYNDMWYEKASTEDTYAIYLWLVAEINLRVTPHHRVVKVADSE